MRPMPSRGLRSWRRPSECHPALDSRKAGVGLALAGGADHVSHHGGQGHSQKKAVHRLLLRGGGDACLDSEAHFVPSAEYPAFGFPLQGSLCPLP